MKRQLIKKTAANGRFGASGGVGSPESLCEFGNLSPVRAAVEAPPAPSRWDVKCKRATQYSG